MTCPTLIIDPYLGMERTAIAALRRSGEAVFPAQKRKYPKEVQDCLELWNMYQNGEITSDELQAKLAGRLF